jgi:hypothetical protein
MKKKRTPPSKIWETFLPIATWHTADLAPAADTAWLLSKGCEAASPALLVQLRDEVLPTVRRLAPYIEWFSFLVHDRASGVPTTEDDKRCYIHLRLKLRTFRRREVIPAISRFLSDPWQFTRKVDLSREIAGVDPKVLDVDRAWAELGKQSEWLLNFIEACDENADGLQLVRLVRQFLHFAANQTQMRVA